ncbi:MAG: NADH-quinone oxidoreductase subunit L [Alphaproteobacteria bacterium]|nr:NADH-quinone oxidoreductase subunit L [Alphaproteobacteria bacterium]
MYQAIVFFPLLGALIAGLFGRVIGHRNSEYITTGLLIASALLSCVAFVDVGLNGNASKILVLSWLQSGSLVIDWTLRIDTLTVVMLVVVTGVSSLVHVYSIGYMSHDEHRARFFAYLSLFTFMMLMLVTADNFLQLFFGWEGVGLASYLLIGFWFKKASANAAAMKAFVVNRVGDFGLILGMSAIYYSVGSLQFDEVFAAAGALANGKFDFLGMTLPALTTICLLLFMGAMGKSAQFLLHTWLPDAMEGPTPVSALIHAATMVTAGVFLVARCSPLFELSQTALNVVIVIGAITAFFAATVGLVQNDIKRVIAYSTCSQLGYMFVGLGIGAYQAAMFHLFTHAFFKALLFLGAGSVIHAIGDEQDMRKMGGLRQLIPATFLMMFIGTIALTGFPLTAGYFSKDAIIEGAFAAHAAPHMFAFAMLIIAAFFTSFYSWRLMFLTFFGAPRCSNDTLSHVHESPPVMLVPLIVLAFGALIAGFAFSGLFIGDTQTAFWSGTIFTSADNHVLHDLHNVPSWVKLSPLLMMLSGFVLAYIMYIRYPKWPGEIAEQHDLIYKFLLNKWYFDEIYDFLFVRPAKWIARVLWKGGDGAIIDGLGPDGIASSVQRVTRRIVGLQTGFVYHYAFVMLLGVASFVTWLMLTAQ